MTHVRQTIREAFVTACTGLTTTGSNVYDTRIFPNAQADMPLLRIYAVSESSEYLTVTNLSRESTIVVEGIARATSQIEDTLDTIAEEVETAVAGAAGITTAGAKDVLLIGTEIELDGDGDNQHGMVRLTYQVLYHTTKAAPGTAL